MSALVEAHAAGITHRDIKPENVMLLRDSEDAERPSDRAKVCDFGIAKLYQQDRRDPELTHAGLLLGSPAYMAPEQILGDACDARTDIYAAGVTLFQMLTGRLPHEGSTMEELFQKKLHEVACRPSELLPDIDPLLEDIVMRALEVRPDQRHASALDVRIELTEALRQIEPPSRNVILSIYPERA